MVNEIEIRVPGDPIPQPRPRAVRVGQFVRMVSTASKECKLFKEAINLTARRAAIGLAGWPVAGPVFLEMDLVWSRNKADRKISPELRLWKMTRPDADNVAKAIMDALHGAWYTDDNQVVGLVVRKYYGAVGEDSHVRICLRALEVEGNRNGKRQSQRGARDHGESDRRSGTRSGETQKGLAFDPRD